MLTVGLLINPVAGIGGAAALKGSDGLETQALALTRGGVPRGHTRARRTIRAMGVEIGAVQWVTWGGAMGQRALSGLAANFRVLGVPAATTSPSDTLTAARTMLSHGIDLLLVVGGDGTLRDLVSLDITAVPVLGVPAGVKMHSGVFATTPEAAAELLVRLIHGGLVQATMGEVRDQDEEALRTGSQITKYFGELPVPVQGGFLQHTKEGGRESQAQAIAEIVADVLERAQGTLILGAGSTCAAIKAGLGLEPTLLGVDVWQDGAAIGYDLSAQKLETLVKSLPEPPTLIVSFTRGQGFLFGRGNQQLSPQILRSLPHEALWVVGTRAKLLTLEGRPLLIDTDDIKLDHSWCGLVQIIAGYEDYLWYELNNQLPRVT